LVGGGRLNLKWFCCSVLSGKESQYGMVAGWRFAVARSFDAVVLMDGVEASVVA
jgi:hypothetical protein